MLPTGLQMLPLLWLLLWMPRFVLSSPLSLGNMPESILSEDTLSFIRVRMVDINNAVYKQFRNTPHSMYMVFNKTELREAVPEPALLFRAKLHLYGRKQLKEQSFTLYERCRNNTWIYLTNHTMSSCNTEGWQRFDVTEVVRRWLIQEDDIEVFRLRAQRLASNKDLQMLFSGITPSRYDDLPDNDSSNRPRLRLLTIPRSIVRHLKRTRQH